MAEDAGWTKKGGDKNLDVLHKYSQKSYEGWETGNCSEKKVRKLNKKKLGHELGFDFENCLSFLIICWWIWFFIHFVGFVDTLWLTWGEYQTLDTKLTQYQTRVNCLGWIESLIHQVQIYRDVDYPIHMVWSWRTKMYQRLNAPVEFAPWKSSSELLDKVKLQNFVLIKVAFNLIKTSMLSLLF